MTDFEYIAGREFTLDDMQIHVGETIPEDYIQRIPLLESWVNAGYIYRVFAGDGYDRLPPHVYNVVMTREEAEAKIEGDPGLHNATDAAQAVGDASETTVKAQEQAAEAVKHAQARKRRGRLTDAEKASAVEVKLEDKKEK